jgi:hypothetical protein
MQSPAPIAKKITGRSDSGDSSKDSDIDMIENIKAITSDDLKDKDKKKRSDDSSDSPGTTITEDRNNPPETEGGPVGAVEGSELPIGVDPKVGVLSNDNSSSSSDDSSSTGGSSKSSDSDISSSDSSDSTRSLITYDSSDSDSFIASKANKMSSSMNKSPVCDGERNSFEEWHSKWEVFGQDHRFDEYQCDIRHPDLPVDGHVTVTMTKMKRKLSRRIRRLLPLFGSHLPQPILLMQ